MIEFLKSGFGSVLVLAVVYQGGRFLLDHRGALTKRWPRVVRYLDGGKVWNLLASAISIASTLLPLAITGDLTRAALVAQLGASVTLFMHSTGASARGKVADADPDAQA